LSAEGKLSAGVNHEGINYYNNLINELMANGHNSLKFIYLTLYIALVSCPYDCHSNDHRESCRSATICDPLSLGCSPSLGG